MKRFALILLGISVLSIFAIAQEQNTNLSNEEKTFFQREMQRYKMLFQRRSAEVTSGLSIDVTYYQLNITVTTAPQYLRGSVLMKAFSMANNLTTIDLDLMNNLTIDSIRVGTTLASFVQHPSSFDVTLDRPYNNGEMIMMEIYYQGVPGSSGFGSFEFYSHLGTPWVWSLSEPYGAKDWWPCKDHPSDKADSADIFVRCDAGYKVGSNGKLLSVVNNGDGTATYHWQERYPISTYLISVAITNYSQFSNWFKYSPTDSMEVLNYVLPEHLSSAMAGLPRAVDGLTIYSNLFGLYPFINEKYGHSEFGWGGGMEHQTMTSLGGFDESLVEHELAHQWFGDMITCRNWPDIWMNEGFATYLEVLYREKKYGTSSYWGRITGEMNNAKNAIGSVYVNDSSNVGTLFNWNLVYAKGSSILHMLRHVLGDSVFFQAMYNYAHDPRYRFGTASTRDFQGVCETTSGKNLNYFFNEWIFGEKYPQYFYGWTSRQSTSGYTVTVALSQTTGTTNPTFFKMPIDFKIVAAGWDTTVTIFNDSMVQTFSFDVSHNPSTVQLDPLGWILKSFSKTFSVYPANIHFGDVLKDSSKSDSVTVINLGSTTLTISSVAADSSGFTVTPTSASILPSLSQKFYVTFTPSSVGVKAGHLIFTHNASTSPDKIAIDGNGTPSNSTINIVSHWNIVSVPFTVSDPRRSVLFPMAISEAFSYKNDSGYVIKDTLKNGAGYWLKFGNDQLVNVSGLFRSTDTIGVTTGWNLIGSISVPVAVASIQSDPPGIMTSDFFGYTGSYLISDTIYPGKGYWVKVNQGGKIILSLSAYYSINNRIKIVSTSELPPPAPVGESFEERIPTEFALEQNHPNPFNPATVIHYQLPVNGWVTLRVYNLLGQAVETLVDEFQDAGYKSVSFDAGKLPSGLYFYRLVAGQFSNVKKMLLMK